MPELTVGDILGRPRRAREGLVTARPDETVRDAARRMAEHSCGSVLVMGRRGDALAGIFTERDLLVRVVAAGLDPARTPVAEVMTADPETIGADAPVRDAVRRMDEGAFRHLPVVGGDGRVVGVLSVRDVPVLELGRMADELDNRHRLAERIW